MYLVLIYHSSAPVRGTGYTVLIEEGFKQKPKQRSSRLFGGQISLNSLPRKLFCLGRFGRIGWIQLFFQIDLGKTASAARNWINSAPSQTDAKTFAFASLSILLLLWTKTSKRSNGHKSSWRMSANGQIRTPGFWSKRYRKVSLSTHVRKMSEHERAIGNKTVSSLNTKTS